MRKNQSKRSFLRQAGLTSQSHQVLPLIVNAKHISNRKQNIKLFDCTTTVRPIPVAPKPLNIVKAKTTLAQPIYKSSFYNNYNNQQQQSKELLPNRSKSMQYFKEELRKLEDEQARLRKEHEEQMNKDEGREIKGLERSKTSIELGALPYTPTFACQLDKRQRFEIYKRRLNIKPAAKSSEEAIEMINKTMDEIEDKYAPKKDDKLYPIYSKRYGRMFPIPPDRIRFNEETNLYELLTVGMIIYVSKRGDIEMWTVPRGMFEPKKLYFKNGVPTSQAN